MTRAQRRGHRRVLGTSMKNAPLPSELGHWFNDCVGRASVPGDESKSFKSPGSEKANNEGSTPALQRLLEGNCRRDREGGGLWLYKDIQPDAGRPEWVKCYLNGMEAVSQIKPASYENGKSTSRRFSITQHPQTPHSRHHLPPRRKPTLAK